ncbi:MAG: hypothetical protein NDI90_15500 [Nitrospira sp. BO4]|nr:hypothetical protein [Nitrospira sp. BO4]
MARKKPANLSYSGPSWAEVQALSDADVDQAFVRLKCQPRQRNFHDDDDQWFIAAHGDKDEDFEWTPKAIQALRERVHEWHRGCLKSKLFRAYIEHWIESLPEDRCWTLIEEYEGTKPSLNDKRYTPMDKVRLRAADATWRHEYHHQLKEQP